MKEKMRPMTPRPPRDLNGLREVMNVDSLEVLEEAIEHYLDVTAPGRVTLILSVTLCIIMLNHTD